VHDVEVPMLSGILASNRQHLDLALTKIMKTGKRKVAFVGLSFKTGTDDLRESPLVTLAEQLIGKGCQLSIYDPEVHLARLLGANKSFIEQHLPHIGQMLRPSLEEVIDGAEVVVLGINAPEVVEQVARRCRPDQTVLDLVKLSNPEAWSAKVQGLSW
jgi:GDP-mannose 6-dehydrogenase